MRTGVQDLPPGAGIGIAIAIGNRSGFNVSSGQVDEVEPYLCKYRHPVGKSTEKCGIEPL